MAGMAASCDRPEPPDHIAVIPALGFRNGSPLGAAGSLPVELTPDPCNNPGERAEARKSACSGS
jgi:hypothetical protein